RRGRTGTPTGRRRVAGAGGCAVRAGARARTGRYAQAGDQAGTDLPVRSADPPRDRGGAMTPDGPKIVIVGAGGWVFPMELTRDILSFPALATATLVLYDVDPAGAERTAAAARELIA